jgi:enhancing lycopene biosynthesis protein 2
MQPVSETRLVLHHVARVKHGSVCRVLSNAAPAEVAAFWPGGWSPMTTFLTRFTSRLA